MSRPKFVLACLVVALFAGDARAITIGWWNARPWTSPGTNPCGDLCDRDWALGAMEHLLPGQVAAAFRELIRETEPVPYAVSTGDTILAMTYAKGGTPFVDRTWRIADFADGVTYDSAGYFVHEDDVTYRFVRVEACGNWAIIIAPQPFPEAGLLMMDALPPLVPAPRRGPSYAQTVLGGPSTGGFPGFVGGFIGGGGGSPPAYELPYTPPPPSTPPSENPGPPSVIPLPTTILLLGAALAVLASFGVRSRNAMVRIRSFSARQPRCVDWDASG